MAVFDQIVSSARSSNLNFSYQETPYSIYLTIRKTKIKNNIQTSSFQTNGSPENVLPDKEAFEKENKFLKNSIDELKLNLNSSYDNTKILEEKVATAEAEAKKFFEEMKKWKEAAAKKDDEIKCLKNEVKNNNAAIFKVENEKTELQKNIKSKEKEIAEMEKLDQGHQITIKSLKEQTNEQIEEKTDMLNKLAKENKDLEEKVNSLLDLLYGCNDCGRHGDFCECDYLEGDGTELSPPDQQVFHQPSPPPAVTSANPDDVHPLTSSTTPWTPPPTPPCSTCGGVNYGPCPTNVCFGCIPPLTVQDTPPCTNSPSRTPPGTPPPLRGLSI